MGTRSLTHVLDDSTESILTTIYRQMDGYPDGHGNDLAAILKGRRMVNGYGFGDTEETASNGAGCLAATIVMRLKAEAGIGGIYLEPPGSVDHGEEYVYTVAPKGPGQSVALKVEAVRGGYGDRPRETITLYEGLAEDFDGAAVSKAESDEEGD